MRSLFLYFTNWFPGGGSVKQKKPPVRAVEKEFEDIVTSGNGEDDLKDVIAKRDETYKGLISGIFARISNYIVPKDLNFYLEKGLKSRRLTYLDKAALTVVKAINDNFFAIQQGEVKAINKALKSDASIYKRGRAMVGDFLDSTTKLGLPIALLSKTGAFLLGVNPAISGPIFTGMVVLTVAAHLKDVAGKSWEALISDEKDLADALYSEIDNMQSAGSKLAILLSAPLLGKVLVMKGINGLVDMAQKEGSLNEVFYDKLQNFYKIAEEQGYYSAMKTVFNHEELAVIMAAAVQNTGNQVIDIAVNQALLRGLGVDVAETVNDALVEEKVQEAVREEINVETPVGHMGAAVASDDLEGAKPA